MADTKRILVICAVAMLVAGFAAAPRAQAATAMTDWQATGANTATGNLLGATVKVSVSPGSSGRVWDPPTSRLDEGWLAFNGPDFSPALPKSDVIQLAGYRGYRYTISFTAPITNPIIELGSVGSRIDFPAGTSITKLSGASGLTVNGSTVSGAPTMDPGPEGVRDSSGTIRLNRTYDAGNPLTFTTTPNYTEAVEDGILLQIVAQVQCTDWTATGANSATGKLLGRTVNLALAPGATGHVWDPPTSRLDASWLAFDGPDFSPALPSSDVIQIAGYPGYRYTLSLVGPAIATPILELGSLGSYIGVTGAAVTRVSGATGATGPARFTAGGGWVSGVATMDGGAEGVRDSSGTIRLGTFSSVTLSTTPNYPELVQDGILVQLCAAV